MAATSDTAQHLRELGLLAVANDYERCGGPQRVIDYITGYCWTRRNADWQARARPVVEALRAEAARGPGTVE